MSFSRKIDLTETYRTFQKHCARQGGQRYFEKKSYKISTKIRKKSVLFEKSVPAHLNIQTIQLEDCAEFWFVSGFFPYKMKKTKKMFCLSGNPYNPHNLATLEMSKKHDILVHLVTAHEQDIAKFWYSKYLFYHSPYFE